MDARSMTWSKGHTEDLKMLGTTIKYLTVMAICHWQVHLSSKL
jgi:hypothetical protein